MYTFYLFDLDGTLINSLEDLTDAANWMLSQAGFPTHSLEEYRYFVGNGVYKLVERCLPEWHRKAEEVLAHKAIFDARYEAHCMDKTRPYPGIMEVLIELKARGAGLGVLSNKSDDFVQKITEGLFGDGIFDVIRGQKDSVPKKPAPDAVWKILEEQGISRGETLFIGDSNVDILTAKNAGLPSAGVSWGFRPEEELISAGADFLIRKPSELLQL